MTRAIASLAVMKLSGKWRSGRDGVRVGVSRPSGRGGKTPHAFGNDEREAAQGDRDMVVPAEESATLEVVEAELVLEVLVDTLGAPPLHDEPNQLFLGSPGL
jgi:hypothetical protein